MGRVRLVVKKIPQTGLDRIRIADSAVMQAMQLRQTIATGVLSGMGCDVSDKGPWSWQIDSAKGIVTRLPKAAPPTPLRVVKRRR